MRRPFLGDDEKKQRAQNQADSEGSRRGFARPEEGAADGGVSAHNRAHSGRSKGMIRGEAPYVGLTRGEAPCVGLIRGLPLMWG